MYVVTVFYLLVDCFLANYKNGRYNFTSKQKAGNWKILHTMKQMFFKSNNGVLGSSLISAVFSVVQDSPVNEA